jgi:hypothetical protein
MLTEPTAELLPSRAVLGSAGLASALEPLQETGEELSVVVQGSLYAGNLGRDRDVCAIGGRSFLEPRSSLRSLGRTSSSRHPALPATVQGFALLSDPPLNGTLQVAHGGWRRPATALSCPRVLFRFRRSSSIQG